MFPRITTFRRCSDSACRGFEPPVLDWLGLSALLKLPWRLDSPLPGAFGSALFLYAYSTSFVRCPKLASGLFDCCTVIKLLMK